MRIRNILLTIILFVAGFVLGVGVESYMSNREEEDEESVVYYGGRQ